MIPAPGAICTELAAMPPAAHLDVDALARILQRHKKTIQKSVRRGELPRPFKFMGKTCWTAGTIVEHIRSLQQKSLDQARDQSRRLAQHGAGAA